MSSISVLLLLAVCSSIVYGYIPRSRSFRPTKTAYRSDVVPNRTGYRRQYRNLGEIFGRRTSYQQQQRTNNNYNMYNDYSRRTLYRPRRVARYNTRIAVRPSIRSRVNHYNNGNDYNTMTRRGYTDYNNYRLRRRSSTFSRRTFNGRRPTRRINRFQRSRMLERRNGNGFGDDVVMAFGPGYRGIYRSYDDDDDDDD